MERYKNIGGNSGVVGFETGTDYIRVQFSDGSVYLYTYTSADSTIIEEMKKLAFSGNGLNAYINRYARKKYAKKER